MPYNGGIRDLVTRILTLLSTLQALVGRRSPSRVTLYRADLTKFTLPEVHADAAGKYEIGTLILRPSVDQHRILGTEHVLAHTASRLGIYMLLLFILLSARAITHGHNVFHCHSALAFITMAKLSLPYLFIGALFIAQARSELYSCGAAFYDPTKVIVSKYYQCLLLIQWAASILVSPAISYARSLAVKNTSPAVMLVTVRPVTRTAAPLVIDIT